MYVMKARNVNDALRYGTQMFSLSGHARKVAPRGVETMEILEPVCTVYTHPWERVLFAPKRDANPFFHFFEALWILAGRDDVQWLAHFLKRMGDYSDNGHTFHGAYGARLHWPHDQIRAVLHELKRDPNSRRAVAALWIPERDSGYTGKDMPCNCGLYFSLREAQLHLTVMNRSNDMVWGAYGANMVQFSTIQQVVAEMLGMDIGTYRQISNSFHVYTQQDAWKAVQYLHEEFLYDPYTQPPLIGNRCCIVNDPLSFAQELSYFMEWTEGGMAGAALPLSKCANSYFNQVAEPMFNAFQHYRRRDFEAARFELHKCHALDWQLAALQWLGRRKTANAKA